MAAEQLPWTKLLNAVAAPVVTPAMEAVGLHPHDPAAPIPNWVAMQVFLALVLVGTFALLRMRLSVESPGGLQHAFEGIRGFIRGLCRDVIGHHWEPFVPFLVSLGLFLLFANLLGLVPFFASPTEHVEVPLGAALTAFIYYNFQGFKHAGISYLQHFLGPKGIPFFPIRFPLLLVIEIISHVARVMSLTIRLWANIYAGEMLLLAVISLVPLLLPISMLGLHIAVAAVQTYVFVLLTTVYLQGATAEDH